MSARIVGVSEAGSAESTQEMVQWLPTCVDRDRSGRVRDVREPLDYSGVTDNLIPSKVRHLRVSLASLVWVIQYNRVKYMFCRQEGAWDARLQQPAVFYRGHGRGRQGN
jgi:hypothetical protein